MCQLDRVRELLLRAGTWRAIDIDSTVCETYGLAKEGASQYTPASGAITRCWPLPSGTGDVLMARLRKGRANTARGAANFLRETVARVRYAGATGALTVRADSGFYAHAIVAVCRKMDVRFSITIRSTPDCAISSPYQRRTGPHTLLDGRLAETIDSQARRRTSA